MGGWWADDGRMREMMMKDKASLSQGNHGYCCSKKLSTEDLSCRWGVPLLNILCSYWEVHKILHLGVVVCWSKINIMIGMHQINYLYYYKKFLQILQMFWLFPSNTEDFNLKGLHQTLKIFPKAFLSDIFFQQTLILKVYQKKFTKSQSGNSLSSCWRRVATIWGLLV